MVSSTSNLPSSAARESDAASVLLYQTSNSGKDPRLWNVQEVTGFMYSIGCSNYADAFIKEVCLTCSHYCLCVVAAISAKSWECLCFLQRSLQFATKILQDKFISGYVVLENWFMPYVNREVRTAQPRVHNSDTQLKAWRNSLTTLPMERRSNVNFAHANTVSVHYSITIWQRGFCR